MYMKIRCLYGIRRGEVALYARCEGVDQECAVCQQKERRFVAP